MSGDLTTRSRLSRPGRRLCRRLAADPGVLSLPPGPARREPVTASQLAGLPPVVQQYLRFMGVVGRPADWSFVAHCTGRFRLRPDWPWLPAVAWQYNSGREVARVFHLRIGGPLPMLARDAYRHGQGSMRGTLLGAVPMVSGAGPEYDVSELVTYLNDAVFCAPSMLLGLPVTWSVAGDRCFDLTLHDAEHRVSARVFLDERGAPVDFSTEDRWCDLPSGLARVRWTTPVRGGRQAGGRWLPTRGTAIWHLPTGDFSYAEFCFHPGDLRHNVAPADLAALARHPADPAAPPAPPAAGRPAPTGAGPAAGWPARCRAVDQQMSAGLQHPGLGGRKVRRGRPTGDDGG
jgi:hypothetical protein